MGSNNLIPFDLPGFEIDRVDDAPGLVVIDAHSVVYSGNCPDCGQSSDRIHSHYTRSPRDLPGSGRKVRLVLSVHRFRCSNSTCSRKTFAERIPEVVPLHGQRTARLTTTLQAIVFELSAEAGARVTQHLKMRVSGDTLCRILRQSPPSIEPPSRIVGMDDWAMKKGHIYGTLLVDLERHQPVDLLPEREVETVTAWLQARPGIEIICRDRASDYAKAATFGAPQATQIADRWHLLKNLGDALQRMLSGQTAILRQAAIQAAEVLSDSPAPPVEPESSLQLPTQTLTSPSTARRQHVFDEVRQLAAQGYSKRAIARQLHVHRATVDRYIHADELPRIQPPRRVSKVAPWQEYVVKRISEDNCSIRDIWRELQAQGFSGQYASVQRAVHRWFPHRSRRRPAPIPRPLSPCQAMWLLVRPSEQLTPDQIHYREILCDFSPDIAVVHDLAQRFTIMVNARQLDVYDRWLADARASGVPALRHFADGLQQDDAAVRAALWSELSNGQTEGQVNRLKVIKRIMYGRARFDLLRLRVLHPP